MKRTAIVAVAAFSVSTFSPIHSVCAAAIDGTVLAEICVAASASSVSPVVGSDSEAFCKDPAVSPAILALAIGGTAVATATAGQNNLLSSVHLEGRHETFSHAEGFGTDRDADAASSSDFKLGFRLATDHTYMFRATASASDVGSADGSADANASVSFAGPAVFHFTGASDASNSVVEFGTLIPGLYELIVSADSRASGAAVGSSFGYFELSLIDLGTGGGSPPTPVLEPGTLLLLGSGGLAWVAQLRRRRRQRTAG